MSVRTKKPTGIRYFYYWCAKCPTRITVETEVPFDAPEGEPQYAFDGVCGSEAHERPGVCPSCGGELMDFDDMCAREYLVLRNKDYIAYYGKVPNSEQHAKMRAALADPTLPRPYPSPGARPPRRKKR